PTRRPPSPPPSPYTTLFRSGREEPPDRSAVELEHAHLRAAALPGAGDDPIRLVVGAADRRDVHAAAEARGIGEEPADRRSVQPRSEEHTSELQSRGHLVCRL